MIVKDEERVIERCLAALIPFIDYWLIIDTGSTDNTINTILKTMKETNLRGEVLTRPWVGFSHNRTELLEMARELYPESDYHLMIDADDTFVPQDEFGWPKLGASGYHLKHTMRANSWWRPALVQASLPWRYTGKAHEHMVSPGGRVEKLRGAKIVCGTDGARRTNEPIKKYERVAAQLEEALLEDPDNPRTVFYLAQSYRDARQPEKALELYKKRVTMRGWPEELWYAHLQIGILSEKLGEDWQLAEAAYLAAYEARPTRAESLVNLAILHRRKSKKHHLAKLYAAAAKDMPLPEGDLLHIDEYSYTWRARDEYALAMWKMGDKRGSLKVNLELLAENPEGLPRTRTIDNITHCLYPISKRPIKPGRITIVLSTYQCHNLELFRESVQSIIDQTYTDWRLLIVCDGDEVPPWDQIELPKDDRIITVALDENVGQFLIYDAIVEVSRDRYFAVQDDDDTSYPHRLERLMGKMCGTNADVVFSDIRYVYLNGKTYYQKTNPQFLAEYPDQITHVGSHVGLWQTQSIVEIGGYFGGLKIGADTLVVGLMSKLGRPAFIGEPLYKAVKNKASMTQSKETGIESKPRKDAWRFIHSVWKSIEPFEGKRRALSKQMLHEARAPWQGEIDRLKLIFSEALGEPLE